MTNILYLDFILNILIYYSEIFSKILIIISIITTINNIKNEYVYI